MSKCSRRPQPQCPQEDHLLLMNDKHLDFSLSWWFRELFSNLSSDLSQLSLLQAHRDQRTRGPPGYETAGARAQLSVSLRGAPGAPGSRSSLTFPSAEPSSCEITACESEASGQRQLHITRGQLSTAPLTFSLRAKAENLLNTQQKPSDR